MNAIRDGGRPDPTEGFMLKYVSLSNVRGVQALELQARIDGRDRKFWLSLDDLRAHIPTDPAVAEALRGICQRLDRIAETLERA